MDANVRKLVLAACPDFPIDREVRQTKDSFQWFKIVRATRTLMIPPVNMLRVNMPLLNNFIEAITAFALCDPNDSIYDWDNLHLEEATGVAIIPMLEKVAKNALANECIVACDIETRGLEWDNNMLLSMGFAWSEDSCAAIYDIPIPGTNCCTPTKPSVIQAVMESIQNFFNFCGITFVWHNGKFDCGKLKYMNHIDARVDEDTMLLHYVGINEKRGSHGLKELGQLYLQAPAWDDELEKIKREYCKKHKIKLSEFQYDMIPTKVLIPYMQRDCIATYRLLKLFKQMARPESNFIYRQLIRASNTYRKVELNGLYIDMNYLEDLEYDLDKEYAEATKRLNAVVKHFWDPGQYSLETGAKKLVAFNPSSPKQMKWMLQQVMGYPVQSTDALLLEHLLAETESSNPEGHEFIKCILALRKLHKQMDTYVQGMRNAVCRDSRVRGTFNLHGTETGRLSSNNPNMQNVPRDKRIKNLFGAAPGTVLVQLDYSQAELRVLATLSGDPSMIQCYVNDEDLHAQVAQDLFGPNFDKEQRSMAKTINFGIAYGRGPSSIAENFGKTMNEARDIINRWFKSKPMVKQYIDQQRAKPLKGEPCVTLLGRERHFVITDAELNHIQNEYINTPIQSLASDMTMLSLLEIQDWIEASGYADRVKIVTTVHDSIILEVVDNPVLVREVATKCQHIMATTPKKYLPECPVPFKADVEVGYTWGNLKELEEYEQCAC